MTYFNLRKRDPETEPEPEEDIEEPEEENENEEQPQQKAHGPIITGLLGPGRWITARFNLDTAIIVHAAALWGLSHGGWIAIGVSTVWLTAVLTFIPREYLERAAAIIEQRTTRRPPQPGSVPASNDSGQAAVVRLLLDVIGDAHGVHLKTVLAHLQEHGQWEGKRVADLRQHLEALGIPVDPKLKVGRVPTRGVSRAALEALSPLEETTSSPAPSPPV